MNPDEMECYHILHWLAYLIKPKTYLEIGVREGASLLCVLVKEPEIIDFVQSCLQDDRLHNSDEIVERVKEGFHLRDPEIICYLFDNWSAEGMEKGEERVDNLLKKGLNYEHYAIYSGDSKKTIPLVNTIMLDRMMVDLAFVDGDHTSAGALADFENLAGHFRVLVAHDLMHPQYPELMDVFTHYCRRHGYPYLIMGRLRMATGVAFAPPEAKI